MRRSSDEQEAGLGLLAPLVSGEDDPEIVEAVSLDWGTYRDGGFHVWCILPLSEGEES